MGKRISTHTLQVAGCLALFMLTGTSLVQAQTWKNSITLYEQALTMHPGFAPALNNLGAAVYLHGETERSLALYQEAIASDPTLTSGYSNIALHLRKKGDSAGALATIRKGLDMIPVGRRALEEEITAWSLLGTFLDERGESDEALAAFAKGAQRGPTSPDARYNYGVSLQKRGMREDARRELLAYLDLRPGDIEARYRLAAIEAELGLLMEAQKNLAIIVSRDPTYEKATEHMKRIEGMLQR
jgi:tetratricopeptide (TPR) repeat protein